MQEPKFIVIEGNIGIGKTTLARMLASELKAELLLERFEDNPFLPLFYNDPDRYAFQLELSFMADRYSQIRNSVNFSKAHHQFLVSDYYFTKSKIFAGVTLTDDELVLFNRLFDIAQFDLPKPDIYVYLSRSPASLLQNIKKRGRSYESGIKADYLSKISEAYMKFLDKAGLNILIIDIEKYDFVKNKETYTMIRDIILNHPENNGLTKMSL